MSPAVPEITFKRNSPNASRHLIDGVKPGRFPTGRLETRDPIVKFIFMVYCVEGS